MGTNNEQNSIVYLPLDHIKASPDNPNTHSEMKIQTLANNIRRFGLLNPISVHRCEGSDDCYEIVAGEGRLGAYGVLDKEEPSGRWKSIASIILEENDEFSIWGRRLSENRIRSFNWIAECVSLAGMKADGVTKEELSQLFGLSEKRIKRMIELGKIDSIQNLVPKVGAARGPHFSDLANEPIIALRAATDYLLPLRIQIERNGNIPIWDYREVDECINKLATGEIKPDEVPLYSADRREAIGKAKAKTETETPQPESGDDKTRLSLMIENGLLKKELKALKNSHQPQKPNPTKEREIATLRDKLNHRDREYQELLIQSDALAAKLIKLEKTLANTRDNRPLELSDIPDVLRQEIIQKDLSKQTEAVRAELEHQHGNRLKGLDYRQAQLDKQEQELKDKAEELRQKLNKVNDLAEKTYNTWMDRLKSAYHDAMNILTEGRHNKYFEVMSSKEASEIQDMSIHFGRAIAQLVNTRSEYLEKKEIDHGIR